tara:strand:- start:59 stop:313 length:255 start_codon:yes stop_codon:yes gene_type:complete
MVLRPEFLIDHPLMWGKINVNTGTNPIIMQDAIMCHNANLKDDDESNVNMDNPANRPVPVKTINNKISHQGIALLRMGERPRKA